MNANELVLNLVHQAMQDLDRKDRRLSDTIRKCIRIARLRGDWDALWWLELETIRVDPSQPVTGQNFVEELKPHYTQDEWVRIGQRCLELWRTERQVQTVTTLGRLVDAGDMVSLSVAEIENEINRQVAISKTLPGPSWTGGAPVDAQAAAVIPIQRTSELQGVLVRLEQRVHDFLAKTEEQLVHGRLGSDVFEHQLQYVRTELCVVAPQALEQLNTAYERLQEETTESSSHALTSCRRALKSLADALYPARAEPVKGVDGKEHAVTDDAYRNRLLQFVADNVKGRASGNVLLANITDLCNRIETVDKLSSKGVHDSVSHAEAIQCVIQTTAAAADILRLAKE